MTIKEIASNLGVSTATVSNVIHGHLEKVSPETAQRVREKLEQYQYVPNMGARMLANGGSNIIGVIFCYPIREDKSAFQDTFVAEMLGSLENEIRNHGYFMMPYVARNAEEICRVATTWNTGGLIVWGIMPEECQKLHEMLNVPLVFVDCYFESPKPISNIGSDDYRGGRMAARHLLQMGHRRIAFLCDQTQPIGVDLRRFSGYRDALGEAGVQWDESLLVTVLQNQRQQQERYAQLAERIRRRDVTALFYASDYYAVLGMKQLATFDLGAPHDYAIVGYDDAMISTLVSPSLTTIHQNVTEKARRAAELLLAKIASPEPFDQCIHLSVRLMRRASVQPLDD